jgi:hypothetical protein
MIAFKEALGITKVPSSVWLRQRLDAKGAELRELTDELTLRLLERTQAPITAYQGYVCADLDTFVMDNSDTKKECHSSSGLVCLNCLRLLGRQITRVARLKIHAQ